MTTILSGIRARRRCYILLKEKEGNVMFNEIWPLISVVLGIVILLVLIIGFKLNTFISLIITSMITALMLGIPLTKIMETIEKGMGSTLGHIALIFGLGAILGNYLLMVVVQLELQTR